MLDEASNTAEAPADALGWTHRFLEDLAVVRSANTVRAYAGDLARWLTFCTTTGVDPLRATPRAVIAFVRAERQRPVRGGAATVSARSVVRRLAAVRQWYAYLALEPEATGVRRNPVPGGAA